MTLAFNLIQGDAPTIDSDCIVAGLFADAELDGAAAALDQAAGGAIKRLIDSGDVSGKAGKHTWLYTLDGIKAPRVLLVGLGKADKLDAAAWAKAATTAGKQLAGANITSATSFLATFEVPGKNADWKARKLALATDHACYRFKISKKAKDERKHLARFDIVAEGADAGHLQRSAAIAEGVAWARDLANNPPNICTPAWLASEAERIAGENANVEAEIFEPDALREMGANALLAVGGGSANGPRLIVLKYTGDGDAKPYALVGKGVTFDAGGINIKPTAGLEEMKFDMGGAAGVMGTFLAAVKMGLKLNLVCVVASAENILDGASYRPSDILTTMAGITVEVLNTDAEGRLCLCDALHYVQRHEPQVIVDAATLTGACVLALGEHATGLMSQDEELAAELQAAGETSLDRAWRLPLWDDYQKQLESGNADVANIGGRPAGAITAGCFLSRFTKGYRWAHLDIAGTAWTSGRKGLATGRPVGLLSTWLESKAGDA